MYWGAGGGAHPAIGSSSSSSSSSSRRPEAGESVRRAAEAQGEMGEHCSSVALADSWAAAAAGRKAHVEGEGRGRGEHCSSVTLVQP